MTTIEKLDKLIIVYSFIERKVNFFQMKAQQLAKNQEQKDKFDMEKNFWIMKAVFIDNQIKSELNNYEKQIKDKL